MSSQAADGLRRRAVLRNGLLAGAAAAVAGLGWPAFTGMVQAAIVDVVVTDPYSDPVDLTAQNQWWWCRACLGLF
jgi:hypothetical protein